MSRVITFSPGPSYISEDTIQAIHEITDSGFLSESHRGVRVAEVTHESIESVYQALGVPRDYKIFLQPSATAAMETILRNCVHRTPFHFVHGAFSERFYQTSLEIGFDAQSFESNWQRAVDWRGADIAADVDLIAVTHTETSTGLCWPEEELKALRAAHRAPLIAWDVTSSLGGVHIDWTQADIFFASVQKCLGMPSGLALLIMNPCALEAAKQGSGMPAWQNIQVMSEKLEKSQTLETPNLMLIALLGKVLSRWDMERVHQHTYEKMHLLHNCELPWSFFIEDPEWRAQTVANMAVDDVDAWIDWALQGEMVLGRGYGALSQQCVRVANFPAIETGMLECLIKHMQSRLGLDLERV